MNGTTTRRNRAHKQRTLSLIPALGTVFLLSVFTVAIPVDARAAETVNVAPAAEKPYVINAASFQSKETAEALSEKFASSGYRSYISKATVKGTTWYRVRVGFYKSASLARAEIKKIASTNKYTKSAWVSRAPLSELAPRTADIKESAPKEVIRAPKKALKAPAAGKAAAAPVKPRKDIPTAARKERAPKPIAATNGRPLKTDAAPRRPYVINVASLQSKRDAELLSEKLLSGGHRSYVSTASVKGKTWYRVRIGFFDNFEAAKKEVKTVASAYGAAKSAWVSRAPVSELKLVKELSRPVAPAGGKVVTSLKDAGAAVGRSVGGTIEKIKKIPETVRGAKAPEPERAEAFEIEEDLAKAGSAVKVKEAPAGLKEKSVSAPVDKAPETYAEEELSSTLISRSKRAQSASRRTGPSTGPSFGSSIVSKLKSATGSAMERIKGIPESVRNGKGDEPVLDAATSLKETTPDDAPAAKEAPAPDKAKAVVSTSAGAAAGTAVGAAQSASGAAATSAGAAFGAGVMSKLKGAGSAVGSATGSAFKSIKSIPGAIRGVKEPAKASAGDAALSIAAPLEETAEALAVEEAPKAGLLRRMGRGIMKPFSFLKFSRKGSKAASVEKADMEEEARVAERGGASGRTLVGDAGSGKAAGGFRTTMTNAGLALPHMLSGVGPISDKAELHGRLSIDDNYSSESNSTFSRNFLTTRLRLDAIKLNDAGTLSVHFGGRYRTQLSGQRYSSLVKPWQVDTLYMEYAPVKDRLYLRLGRLTPKEGVGENVDGVNVLLKRKAYGVGAFAGTKPDPFTGGFDASFTSSGAYAYYRRDQLFSNISFVNNTFKGKVDRQYMSGNISFTPIKNTRIFGAFTSDINQDSGGMEFTNGFVELSYRPNFNSSVAVGAREFRAIRLYESMDFAISTSRQTSFYVRGNYRLMKKYSITGKVETRTQANGGSLGNKDTQNYMLAVGDGNILGSRVSGNFSTTYSKGYNSTYTLYDIRLMRELVERVELTLNGSVMENEYGLTGENDTTLRYGASLHLRPGRSWNISLSYDGTKRDDYSTTNINSRVSYRF